MIEQMIEDIMELFSGLRGYWSKAMFTDGTRIKFYRAIILLYRNGLSPLEALNDIHGNFNGKPMGDVAFACLEAVEDGGKMSQVLKEWIPQEEVMLIAAGERSGQLVDGFSRAIEAVQHSMRVKKTVQGLVYPVMLIAGIGFLMNTVSTTIVPQILQMGNLEALPFESRILVLIGELSQAIGLVGVCVLAFTGFGVVVTLPYFTGPIRVWADKLPPWSIYQNIKGAQFLQGLVMLQGGGAGLEGALEHLEGDATPWLAERINAVLVAVRTGQNLGHALGDTGYDFPNREAVRYLKTIASKEGSGKNIEQFANDWTIETLENVDLMVKTLMMAGLMVFYGVIFLIFAGMNSITNNVMTSSGF